MKQRLGRPGHPRRRRGHIPVVGTDFAAGEALYALRNSGLILHVKVSDPEIRTTVNVIAETEGGRDDNVVVVGVYDGDDSAFPVGPNAAAGPPGSADVESLFTAYFASRGLASEPTAFSGRSDYGPFIAAGIPAGGLFTGAEGIKTPAQAATYGGTAGQPYDPCYHASCDTIANVNTTVLDQMADAVAYAVLAMAMITEGVNGERGKGNFKPSKIEGELAA